MKIAVTSTGGSMEALVSERFGRCQYFLIIDTETNKFEAISNLGEQTGSGAGPKAVEQILHKGAEVLLTGHIGDKAEETLKRTSIKVFTDFAGNEKVKDAVKRYLNLKEN